MLKPILGVLNSHLSNHIFYFITLAEIKKNANRECALQDQLPMKILSVRGQAQLDMYQAS